MIDELWANVAVDFCAHQGVDHFFLAPGSRCTPLTLAAAKHPCIHRLQHFDERGLAFATLGYGRATSSPAVFVCTSGTAVANAFPAVVESSMESIPLILFTADRPDELRGSGANQTIEQREIFGGYVRRFVNLPVPGDTDFADDPNGINYLIGELQEAVRSSGDGPVQVNWMFREPFTISDERVSDSEKSVKSRQPPNYSISNQVREETHSSISEVEVEGNTVIALGSCKPDEAMQALELSRQLNCPLLADVTSGLKAGAFELPSQFALPEPNTIIHIGGRIVSKSWLAWTKKASEAGTRIIHITSTGQTINPNGLPIQKLHTSLTDLCSEIEGKPTESKFFYAWQTASEKREQAVAKVLDNEEQLSEPAIARHISESCPQDVGLLIGNSTPIRDMDWYGQGDRKQARYVEANRGASGIDGLIATATGFAAGLQRSVTVVLGDLATLHDLNSLSLVANSKWPLVIVIINNHAGHIFDLLPVQKSQYFEDYFATPHTYGFEHAAKMFGLQYEQVSRLEDFKIGYKKALGANCSAVLEVVTQRSVNLEVRQRIREEIESCEN